MSSRKSAAPAGAVALSPQPRLPRRVPSPDPSSRLVSLDAFRGFVIAAMLLVNNLIWTAATPRQLMHAPWGQGVTFTDMIFPWFMLAMGVAIPFSLASARENGQTLWGYLARVARRSGLLVILGWMVDSTVAHRVVLGMGVLQLLGVAYFIGALAARLPLWNRVALAALLLGAHWALIRFVPVPGAEAPVFDEDLNIIKYLNEVYLGPHLAGVISAVPTSALVLLGTAAGDVLRRPALPGRTKGAVLLAIGTVLALGGWMLQHDLPLNKPVWSASYILVAGGLGALLLGVCYLVFDLARLRAPAYPFAVFGANAIVVYVASILFKIDVLQAWRHRLPGGQVVSLQEALVGYLGDRFGPGLGGWIYTAAFIVFWWLVLLYLYRRRIFVRV
jgi:predicted acyltransferase